LLSKTGQLKIYQPKSLFPMDPAVVVLWGFAFISILIGNFFIKKDFLHFPNQNYSLILK